MTAEQQGRVAPPKRVRRPVRSTAPKQLRECDAAGGVCPVADLRAALAREAVLLHERDVLLEQQATLSRESDHRLLNNLQMVSSLLSMQGRAAANPETATALKLAADRISTIGRIHRHLHSSDGVERVDFGRFLEELCRDVTLMLSLDDHAARPISVNGVALYLPTEIAVPLGFIANELITNALKYGQGPIVVHLKDDPRKGFALSVESGGPALPSGFDPAASKGLGMRIIRSLVERIDGELCISRGQGDLGARFIVLFAHA